MSILEDNKLIAKWLNITLSHTGEHDFRKEYFGKPYQPHKDWNQLMEAVEKIETDGCVGESLFRFHITGLCCELYKYYVDMDKPKRLICEYICKTKIQAVYQAVLEYIKQQKEG